MLFTFFLEMNNNNIASSPKMSIFNESSFKSQTNEVDSEKVHVKQKTSLGNTVSETQDLSENQKDQQKEQIYEKNEPHNRRG